MDCSPIPFPTLSLQDDEHTRSKDARPPLPPRIHSSPSLPNIWLPGQASVQSARKFQAYRPHLRPLDLAASPDGTPTAAKFAPPSKRSISGSPSRPPSLLTPPLTPSSFNSTANDCPATPPETSSPLRWVHSADTSYTPGAVPESPTTLKGHKPLPHAGYLTPSSGRSKSISSDTDSGYAASTTGTGIDISSALAAGIANLDITPRDEKKIGLPATPSPTDDAILHFLASLTVEDDGEKKSHFLLVRNVPRTAASAHLRDAFSTTGDIKGIWVRFQESHGFVILAFWDVRHAVRAQKQLSSGSLPGLGDVQLRARPVNAEQLEMVTGKSAFVDETDGTLLVTVEDCRFQAPNLQNLLSSFGDLLAFEAISTHDQMYHVEYCDIRDAQNAYRALNGRNFLGIRLRLCVKSETQALPEGTGESGAANAFSVNRSAYANGQQIASEGELRCMEGRIRPRSVSVGESMGAPDAVRRVSRGRESPQEHNRRSSNDLFFDAIGKGLTPIDTPTRPRSISIGPDNMADGGRLQRAASLYAPPPETCAFPGTHYAPEHGSAPRIAYPHEYSFGSSSFYTDRHPNDPNVGNHWTFAAPPPPTIEYYLPPSPRATSHHNQVLPTTPRKGGQTLHPPHRDEMGLQVPADYPPFPSELSMGRRASAPNVLSVPPPSASTDRHGESHRRALGGPAGGSATGSNISDKNQLKTEKIEQGKDTRTTVMIKNIPNKMSDRDLLAFINRVCPRRIDFLYLRMDFQNGCNVGYAFVNFITVGDLLHFAKTQLDVKWNMYSSEKKLQLCYATYQGKEALVEKFKNSCIMDEREAWRPKIFYSDGPNQGLPEPFPPPTHLRRKERSSHNRGALFVPGPHHPHQNHRERDPNVPPTLYHHRPHPPRMSAPGR